MECDSEHDESLLPAARPSQSLVVLLWRALRLRCPSCGQARIFRGWFAMHKICPACGRQHQRDAGFFLGSIYFNYTVTGLLVVVIYFSLYFGGMLTDDQRLAVLAVFVVLFPTWFFRYARGLWMAGDEYFDPWPNVDEARASANAESRK
jgi:uncharacterized protein (DUF983 family)